MHCLCKSISSSGSTSAVFPITSNAYTACRIVGFHGLLSSYRDCSTLVWAPTHLSNGLLLSSKEISPLPVRPGLHTFLTCKVSAADGYHRFSSIRGLKSAPKKNAFRNPSPSSSSGPNFKKSKANAGKASSSDSRAFLEPLQAQKGTFTKRNQAETRKSLKPAQAQRRSSDRPVKERAQFSSNISRTKTTRSCVRGPVARANFKDSSSRVKKGTAVNESVEEEDLDDDNGDEESLDDEDDDFGEEDEELDEDIDDVEDEDLDVEFVEDGADDDDLTKEDKAFIDDMLEEEGEGTDEVMIGDGGDGGGLKSTTTAWGEKALLIAKGVLHEFGDNFSLYAFKTSVENRVFVRLDNHSDRYGSPSIVEIESFSSIYGKRLEEAGQAGDMPENLALEVSSPGAERVVQVPDQLLRFKDLPMFVRYEEELENDNKTSPVVKDSILQIESIEAALGKSVWKLANVRANRENTGKGKGRALNKKQKEWRLELPLSSLRLVRLYMDI